MFTKGPIGVFDSGYGGLTILKEIVKLMPAYNFTYLGDNARAPYGPRSFDTVYQYTWECVQWFFKQNCPLVILACNTASAKALRTIQQVNLPATAPDKRVLGVIRPTTERIGEFTKTGSVGILGTKGTVQSESYVIEIKKSYPKLEVYQQACPMLVPLIENNEYESEGADFFIKKYLTNLLGNSNKIDTILLACTHYPLLKNKFEQLLADNSTVVSQGSIIAESLVNYLERHTDIDEKCSKTGKIDFYTTDLKEDFEKQASIFYGQNIIAQHLNLNAEL